MSLLDGPLQDDLIQQAAPALISGDSKNAQDFPYPVENRNANPLDIQLRKVISVIMRSRKIACTKEYLDQITDLSIAFLNNTVSSLRKFTELQRRRNPSFGDTQQFLRTRGINPSVYVEEIIRSRQLDSDSKKQIKKLQKSTETIVKNLNSFNENFDPNDESLPFFTNEVYQIASLVPTHTEKPEYVPAYLPDFPPDFTYQNTSHFMDRVTDLKQLRLKLVEESKLTESSLYNLIEDDERKWKATFEKELESFEQHEEPTPEYTNIMTLPPEIKEEQPTKEQPADTIAPTEEDQKKNPKSFDFVEYAKKRNRLFKLRIQNDEKKAKLRANNIFMKAEKYFSPYATMPYDSEAQTFFKNLMKDEFKSVIKSVRRATKLKEKRTAEMLREQSRMDRLGQDGTESFGFDFGQIMHSDDESDENEQFPMFDFPDENEDGNMADTSDPTHKEEVPNSLFQSEIDQINSDDDLEAQLGSIVGNDQNTSDVNIKFTTDATIPNDESNIFASNGLLDIGEIESDEDEFENV